MVVVRLQEKGVRRIAFLNEASSCLISELLIR